ncbi:hypothetical protein MTR_8g471050 [Medicago truncatula]|uniref:Uncharacterized protein n=1 Tax=Medicago truncatula TaxID=3880 RepID=A0A072TRC4_MEDTR|nr:hypothetical protein MTR_8g066955 [Medicago truncatula]KEH20081.1 hypothetical protein MTR_8g471050 [Medicago truncatula]
MAGQIQTMQPIVTPSTIEAEDVAAASCSCQGIWLRRILDHLSEVQLLDTFAINRYPTIVFPT